MIIPFHTFSAGITTHILNYIKLHASDSNLYVVIIPTFLMTQNFSIFMNRRKKSKSMSRAAVSR